MTMLPSDDPAPAWSNLWAQSPRGAIDLAADDPVAAALRAHWQAQLAWLADCDEVVDVGSGPAVLPRHLLSAAPGVLSQVQWRCLDKATFVPAVAAAMPAAITIHGGVDFAASQPIVAPAAALISNFGLEYVDRSGLATACRRWLAAGGRLSAVIHARGSIIDQVSNASADDIRYALDAARLFDRSRDLFVAMASLPSDPMERMMYGVDIRDAYNASVNGLKRRMEDKGAYSAVLIDMLTLVSNLAGRVPQSRLDDVLAELQRREGDYAAEVVRLSDMQASAMDEAQMAALAQELRVAGFGQIGVAPLTCTLGLLGWTLSAALG
jgi:hypothetical protein